MKKSAPGSRSGRRPTAAPPAAPEPTIGLGLAALLYFGLALIYFLPAFLPGRQIYGTDYLHAGYFFYDFIAQRVSAGALPKWVPYVYGGLPLFANPGSTYYPIRWIAELLLPTGKFLPFLFVFQFGMAGMGMYLLAHELRCRRWVAFVAGLTWEFTGITMSWVYAGHDGRIIVATLAPLFFFFLHRGIRTARLPSFAGAAATVGFALLSFQIQNAYYLLLAGAIWAVFCLFHLDAVRDRRRLAKTVAMGLGAVAFAFVMAAVNFIPFQAYVGQSPRGQTGGRGYEFSTSFSMPPRALVGTAVPEQVGLSIQDPNTGEIVFPVYGGENAFKLHTEYLGALVLVLLALGAFYARRDRRWWFFAGLGAFALLLALGGNTPFYRFFYELLPGLKRFRAPDLAYYVAAFSAVAMAALTLERLALSREAVASRRTAPEGAGGDRLDLVPLIAGGVVVVAILGAALLGVPSAAMAAQSSGLTPALGWLRFALFTAAVGGVLWWWTAGRMSARAALLALALVAVVDLWTIDRKFFYTTSGPEQAFAMDDVVAFLLSQPQPNRVWALPVPQAYRGNSDYLMRFGIDQVAGEHGNQLQRYNEYLGAGVETYVDYHNFLADPSVVETAQGQAISFRPAPGFPEAANVRYVISLAPLAVSGYREIYRGSALIYENTAALPRAYLVPQTTVVPSDRTLTTLLAGEWDPARTAVVEAPGELPLPAAPLRGGAQVTEYEPDRVVVRTEANRPAYLVLADNFYPGWRATIDGAETPVYRTNHTFRGLVVPAGAHRVEFTFHPDDLYTGLWIHLASLALLAGYGVLLLIRRRRGPVALESAPPE